MRLGSLSVDPSSVWHQFYREEFQSRLHSVLCSIDGMVNIADAIIIVGKGESLAAATHDHDHTVMNLLNCLSQHKLKFIPTRSSSTATVMGHICTPEGLKTSAKITPAVLDMPQPSDEAATQCIKVLPKP